MEKLQTADKNKTVQTVTAYLEEIHPEQKYGFIKTINDHYIYFDQSSIQNAEFDQLKKGSGVRFTAESDEFGINARTVEILQGESYL